MARFLVTGGCGFIGSHLTEALIAAGHRVDVLDDLSSGFKDRIPSEAGFEQGCVTDRLTVSRLARDIDGIFHLAAVASVEAASNDVRHAHAVNAGGTVNLIAAATEMAVPLILASSAAVYGNTTETPIPESAPTRPISAYGIDKLSGEMHAAVAARDHGLRVTAIRPFNVYGPRQNPRSPYTGVIARFIDTCMAGGTLTIEGDGAQDRDFIYVTDIVQLFVDAFESSAGDCPLAVNGCTGTPTSINALAQQIRELTDHMIPIVHGPARVGDIRSSVGNPALAHAALGFQAGTPLQEGLRRTLAWQANGRTSEDRTQSD